MRVGQPRHRERRAPPEDQQSAVRMAPASFCTAIGARTFRSHATYRTAASADISGPNAEQDGYSAVWTSCCRSRRRPRPARLSWCC